MTMKRGALFLGIAGIGCAACAGGGRNRVTGSETLIAQARACLLYTSPSPRD